MDTLDSRGIHRGFRWAVGAIFHRLNQASQWPSLLDSSSPRSDIGDHYFSLHCPDSLHTHPLLLQNSPLSLPSIFFFSRQLCDLSLSDRWTVLGLVNASGSEIKWQRLSLTSPASSKGKRWGYTCVKVVWVRLLWVIPDILSCMSKYMGLWWPFVCFLTFHLSVV